MRNIKSSDLMTTIFYQVPKWLMDLFIDKKISQGAFKTYILMYDRLKLSAGNKWIDKNGDVYIKYSYDEMTADLNCSRQAVSNNLQDLEKLNLIDKKRNFSSSSTFYLKIYSTENDSSLENLTSKENLDCHSSRKLDCSSLENLDSNNNNFNNNNINNNKKILSNDNIQKVQEEWNILANELNLPKIDKIDGKRLSNLNARIKKYGIEKFLGVMQKIRKSKFLKGEVNDFRATFDFLVTASSFEKIKDGNYESKENKKIDPNTDRMRRLTEVVRKRNNAGAIDNSE